MMKSTVPVAIAIICGAWMAIVGYNHACGRPQGLAHNILWSSAC